MWTKCLPVRSLDEDGKQSVHLFYRKIGLATVAELQSPNCDEKHPHIKVCPLLAGCEGEKPTVVIFESNRFVRHVSVRGKGRTALPQPYSFVLKMQLPRVTLGKFIEIKKAGRISPDDSARSWSPPLWVEVAPSAPMHTALSAVEKTHPSPWNLWTEARGNRKMKLRRSGTPHQSVPHTGLGWCAGGKEQRWNSHIYFTLIWNLCIPLSKARPWINRHTRTLLISDHLWEAYLHLTHAIAWIRYINIHTDYTEYRLYPRVTKAGSKQGVHKKN